MLDINNLLGTSINFSQNEVDGISLNVQRPMITATGEPCGKPLRSIDHNSNGTQSLAALQCADGHVSGVGVTDTPAGATLIVSVGRAKEQAAGGVH